MRRVPASRGVCTFNCSLLLTLLMSRNIQTALLLYCMQLIRLCSTPYFFFFFFVSISSYCTQHQHCINTPMSVKGMVCAAVQIVCPLLKKKRFDFFFFVFCSSRQSRSPEDRRRSSPRGCPSMLDSMAVVPLKHTVHTLCIFKPPPSSRPMRSQTELHFTVRRGTVRSFPGGVRDLIRQLKSIVDSDPVALLPPPPSSSSSPTHLPQLQTGPQKNNGFVANHPQAGKKKHYTPDPPQRGHPRSPFLSV